MKYGKWMLWLSIVLIVIGVVGNLVTEWQSQDLQSYIAGLDSRFSQLDEHFASAVEEIANEESRFAAHWSSVPQQDVQRLTGYFAEINDLLSEAHSAKSSDWDRARSVGQLAESRISEVEVFCDRMLGTADSLGYYATLQFQTDNVHVLIEELDTSIQEARQLITGLDQDPWNQNINLSFRDPLSDLYVAVLELQRLQDVHWLNFGADAEIDWPQLYRALDSSSIRQLVDGARTKANNLHAQSREADEAIRRAEETILNTDRYIERGRYQYYQALDELAVARETLNRAYVAFGGDQQLEQLPDYVQAKDLAQQAISEAYAAYAVASTPTPTPSPTPTPEPTNTPVPVIIIADDDNNSGFDFSGSSGSNIGGPSFDFESSSGSGFGDSSYFNSGDPPSANTDPWGDDGYGGNSDPWGGDDGY